MTPPVQLARSPRRPRGVALGCVLAWILTFVAGPAIHAIGHHDDDHAHLPSGEIVWLNASASSDAFADPECSDDWAWEVDPLGLTDFQDDEACAEGPAHSHPEGEDGDAPGSVPPIPFAHGSGSGAHFGAAVSVAGSTPILAPQQATLPRPPLRGADDIRARPSYPANPARAPPLPTV